MPKIAAAAAAAAAVEHTPCETCDVSDFLLSSHFRTDNNVDEVEDEHDGSRWYVGLLLINDKSFIYDETRDDSAATFNFRFGRFMRPTESIYYTHCCTKQPSVRSKTVCTFSHFTAHLSKTTHIKRAWDTHGGKLGKKSFSRFELLWISFLFFSLDFRCYAFDGVAATPNSHLNVDRAYYQFRLSLLSVRSRSLVRRFLLWRMVRAQSIVHARRARMCVRVQIHA